MPRKPLTTNEKGQGQRAKGQGKKKTKTKKKTSKRSANRAKPPTAGVRFEMRSLADVNPAAYNPRIDLQPGDPEFAKLARSIDEFGCAQALVFNERTGNLVGGHQTLKVLRHLGTKEAMMSIVDLPLEKEKAMNLALNRITGRWDVQALADLMQGLEAEDDPELIELTGFDDGEVDRMLAELEGDPIDDDSDAADEKDHSVKLGNVFEAVAECNDEREQQRAYELLKENGYTCRIRTI